MAAASRTLSRNAPPDDHVLVTRSWDDLLNSQLLLVESAMTFNKAMSQKFAAERLTPPTTHQVPGGKPWAPSVNCCAAFHSDLIRHQVEEKDREQNETEEEPMALNVLRQPLLGRPTSSSKDMRARLGQPRVAFDEEEQTQGGHSASSGIAASSRQESGSTSQNGPGGARKERKQHTKEKGVFTLNAEDMRRRLRECFKHESIMSEAILQEAGPCGRLARSNAFNTLVLVVIILNSLWIAVDVDYNKTESLSDAPVIFQVIENLFCFFFAFELIVRTGSLQSATQALDGWFIFDSSLTIMMIWDTWVCLLMKYICGHDVVSSQMRSFTILRVLRVLRKGMVIAMRSTCTILALLLIVVYIFAILFTQLLADNPVGQGSFENVPQAMNFLLLQTLSGADVNVINKLLAAGWTYYLLYLTFVFMGSLTLMNMLIGVLCEVVGVVAQIEEERAFHEEAQNYISNFVNVLDMDGDQMLSKVEFLQLMERDPDLLRGLQAFGIDVVAFCDNAIALFADTEHMEVGDFVELVTQFRSQKQTTVKDLVDMRKFISMQLRHLADEVRGRFGQSRIEAALEMTHGPSNSPSAAAR